MILRLDAPKRRGALYAWINNHNKVIGLLGVLTLLGGAGMGITALVTACLRVGVDDGDESPLFVTQFSFVYFLVALAMLVAFFVADEKWGMYGDTKHRQSVKTARERYAKIVLSKNSMLIDAADGLMRDLAVLTGRGYNAPVDEYKEISPRLLLLAELAEEAEKETKQRELVGDTNVESAQHALEAIRHARKELAA